MPESSHQLARQSLNQAMEVALAAFQARIQALPPETRSMALRCLDGIQACLLDLAEARTSAPTVQDDLVRLIFSHADPELVGALREFAEVLILHLGEARNRLQPPIKGRRDS